MIYSLLLSRNLRKRAGLFRVFFQIFERGVCVGGGGGGWRGMRDIRVERRGGEKGWLGKRVFFFFLVAESPLM